MNQNQNPQEVKKNGSKMKKGESKRREVDIIRVTWNYTSDVNLNRENQTSRLDVAFNGLLEGFEDQEGISRRTFEGRDLGDIVVFTDERREL